MKSCSAMIFDQDMEPLFVLQFYHLDVRELQAIGPGVGGSLIPRALREKGHNPDDFMASPFAIWAEPAPIQ